jgi:hypothetical protein
MGALSATTPTNTGATTSGAAVAASDTIARSVMGPKGVYLEIINGGGSTDNITISDSGSTSSGNSPGTVAGSVANGASKVFYIHPDQVNPSTGNVTVTHSFTTSVTYKMYPVD